MGLYNIYKKEKNIFLSKKKERKNLPKIGNYINDSSNKSENNSIFEFLPIFKFNT
jgi:hypothetical protein